MFANLGLLFAFGRAVAIVILIARSKLVPDFAITIHFVHLVLTTLYTRSLPRHSMWWATMVGSAAVSVALGMWGCRYRELQPVFFGGGRILGSGTTAPPSNALSVAEQGEMAAPAEEDDNGSGFSRGRGRGRGRDGAGEYEMMHMKQGA